MPTNLYIFQCFQDFTPDLSTWSFHQIPPGPVHLMASGHAPYWDTLWTLGGYDIWLDWPPSGTVIINTPLQRNTLPYPCLKYRNAVKITLHVGSKDSFPTRQIKLEHKFYCQALKIVHINANLMLFFFYFFHLNQLHLCLTYSSLINIETEP